MTPHREAERIVASEKAQWAALIEHDDGTPAIWEDLTRKSMAGNDRLFAPRYEPDSAFTPTPMLPTDEARQWAADYYGMSLSMVHQWEYYALRWKAFVELNPRVRLAWMLGDVSESHDASSWPYEWSHLIRDWVASGFAGERPFTDHGRIDTPEWRAELRRAWVDAGRGWVFWTDSDVFVWEPTS